MPRMPRRPPHDAPSPGRASGTTSPRDPRVLAAVFAGGAAGGGLRAVLAEQVAAPVGRWPWVTFAVNVVGALVLGWVAGRGEAGSAAWLRRRPLLGTGFCGGLTTFATLQLELLHLLDAHRFALAAGYLVASLTAGLLAVLAGTRAARRVPA